MKLHEKIRQMRAEKSLTMRGLGGRLKEIYGEKALKYNTLARIERGETQPRMNSLMQICVGLRITLKELKEGVEEEYLFVDFIKKTRRFERFTYNVKVFSYILTSPKRNFLCVELVMNPQGKTAVEQDPIEDTRFEKWVYCLRGEVTCYVGQDDYTLRRGDCLSFESTLPHYFENKTSKKSSCIIAQNPRHL